jgi:uncharacterized ion transporter superfamily protein YfcC
MMRDFVFVNMSPFVLAAIILVIAIIAISFIFQYLIHIEKIKPTKLSRLFYEDDDSFTISWKKQQQKGISNYVMKNTIIITVINSMSSVVSIFYKRYEYTQVLIGTLIMGVVFGLLISLFVWNRNQDRFNRLKNQ